MKLLRVLSSLFKPQPLGIKFLILPFILPLCACWGFAFMGDANWQQDCYTFHVTYLSGIPNGPAQVYWEGGEYITHMTATLTGVIGDSFNETIGTFPLTELEPGARSVEFPIDAALAQQVLDANGTFSIILIGFGRDPYNFNGDCTTTFSLAVADMTSTNPTPQPTAIPPTAVPPTNVPPTAVPPTAIPPTAVPPTAIPPTTPPVTAP